MRKCFIIQPFDGGRFDKRFRDVIVPAVKKAGLEPYRVDQDPEVTIPIADIEQGIRSSAVCLADITIDNPNVWFELGFAIALNKPTVILCSDERKTSFPFDVQHRSIIRYVTEAPSDYINLQTTISKRLTAILKKDQTLNFISENSSLAPIEGLTQQELITLAAIAENITFDGDNTSTYAIHRDVESHGFTKIAAVIGLKSLGIKMFIVEKDCYDAHEDEPYTGYELTQKGWDWMLKNQDKFQIQKPQTDNDIPF